MFLGIKELFLLVANYFFEMGKYELNVSSICDVKSVLDAILLGILYTLINCYIRRK